MGRRDGPSKSDRIAYTEVLKEKGIMTISPQQEDFVNKPKPKVRLESYEYKNSSSRDPMKRLA
jgi:hypothetical protein